MPSTGVSGSSRAATRRPSSADASRSLRDAGSGTRGQSWRSAAAFSAAYAGACRTAMTWWNRSGASATPGRSGVDTQDEDGDIDIRDTAAFQVPDELLEIRDAAGHFF